jgi:hypothetical protein
MEHEISVKRELNIEVDISSDSEPQLEIADDHHNDHDQDQPVPSGGGPTRIVTNGSGGIMETSKDVVESLLLLGRQAVLSPESQRQRAASVSISPSTTLNLAMSLTSLNRRHSSGSDIPLMNQVHRNHHDQDGTGAVVTYYQVKKNVP